MGIPHDLKLVIKNIVAVATFENQVDLEELAQVVPGARYEPEVFGGPLFRWWIAEGLRWCSPVGRQSFWASDT